MRDLKKDKAMCNAEITETPGAYTIDVEELEKGFYMWRERALMAETKVARLTEINQGCEQEARLYDDLLHHCRAENAKLRAVMEAARGIFLGEGEHLCSEFEDAMDQLRQALAELDKEDTHD